LSEWRPNFCRCIVLANVAVLRLGALAAAPGSVVMPGASPACFHHARLFAAVFGCGASHFLVEHSFNSSFKSSPIIGWANSRSASAPFL
jgi:hypothetical protein